MKAKLHLYAYYNTDHRLAIMTLLNKLDVITNDINKILSEGDTSIDIEFNEDCEALLRELSNCDFICLTDFEK